MRFYLALILAKICAWLIQRLAKGRGTNFPGEVALRIDPSFVAHMKGIDPEKAIFVTGTNGKSTSTTLIHHVFTNAGYHVLSNLQGANLLSGVATALLAECSITGRVHCDLIVMETDERYLRMIREQLPAKYVCITNFQKDQAQRNGEPSFVMEKVGEALSRDVELFLNCNEPNALSMKQYVDHYVTYGAEPHSRSYQKNDDFFSVSRPCPVCHNPIHFETYNIENIGPFHCTHCGFQSMQADYHACDVDFENKHFTVNGKTYFFGFNTPYFLYCYVMAVAVASELGMPTEQLQKALEQFDDIHGLVDTKLLGENRLHYIKMKQENSETLQSALNLIAEDREDKVFLMYHTEYIDLFPPFANLFYFYDCDFQKVLASGLEKWVCMCDSLGKSMALRLLYDGFPEDGMIITRDSREETIRGIMDSVNTKDAYLAAELTYWKMWGGGNL